MYGTSHNPYFNRWFSAIINGCKFSHRTDGHNPYFNRWFSAIAIQIAEQMRTIKGHNPYFNRWFSAICPEDDLEIGYIRHNPYFNRWFSAIKRKTSN